MAQEDGKKLFVRPTKDIDQMSDEELRLWSRQVIAAVKERSQTNASGSAARRPSKDSE